MLKTTLRILSQVGGALVAFVVGTVLLAAVRLGIGPVSVPWLLPQLQATLNETNSQFRVSVGAADITWLGWEHLFALRLLDVEATDDNGRSIADIPALAISFSREALRERLLAPTAIRIIEANLWLVRGFDGTLHLAATEDQDASEPVVRSLLAQLTEPNNPQNRLSYLDEIEIVAATLVYTDQKLGATWQTRIASAELRQDADGILLDARIETDARGQTAVIAVQGAYEPAERRLTSHVAFSDLNPAALAKSAPTLAPMTAFDIPFSGSLQGTFSLDGHLQRADISLGADRGVIRADPLLGGRVPRPRDAPPLTVRSLRGTASYDAVAGSIDVSELAMAFEPGATLALPEPIDHAMPLKSIAVSGHASDQLIDVSSLAIDLDGVVVTATGRVQSPRESPAITVHAETSGLGFNDLHRYWPQGLASGARDWVINHLSNGLARTAEIDVALAETAGEIDLVSLGGKITADGIKVDYLPRLPAFTDAAGVATFDAQSFTVEVKGGQSGARKVTGGTVTLYDFAADVARLRLDLSLVSPLPDALRYINEPPLEFLDGVDIDLDKVSGKTQLRLQLDLPLLKNIPMKAVDLSVIGEATDVAVSDALPGGRDIRDGTLRLSVDTEGMNIDGPITVDTIPGYLTWEETFAASAEIRRALRFAANRVPARAIQTIAGGKIDVSPYLLGGSMSAHAAFTQKRDETQAFDIDMELTEAETALPAIHWRKPAGRYGRLRLVGRVAGGRLQVIDPIRLAAVGLDADGSIQFTNGKATRIVLRRMRGALTDISGHARLDPKGVWQVTFGGTQFNLASIVEGWDDGGEAADDDAADLPDLFAAGKIDRVWVGEGTHLQDFDVRLAVEQGRWQDLWVNATDGAGTPWSARIAPDGPRRRSLEVRSGNAGTTLRNLRIYDDMYGGDLTLNGVFDDGQPSSPLSGRLKVKDFRLEKAPVLARLLNVASFTGIANTLTGRGISITELNAPFTMERGRIVLSDARMYGSSVGLTAEGTIDTRRDVLDVRGTVVPFYTVNSVLGRIPVIGDVFSGGEKGGGVFAATYRLSGPIENPEVGYNPLATLAPGFLRKLFNIFDGAEEPAP